MNVVVLGGSAAGGNTGAGCAGYLLIEGETRLVVDLGPGTLLELRKHVDFRAIDGIVISHYHLDHILDIGALRYLGKYHPEPIKQRKIPLWIPPGTRVRFAIWTDAFGSSDETEFLEAVFNIAEYDPVEVLNVGDLSISFATTVHSVPAWAMRVTGPSGGDFGYTADTGPTADLAGFFRGVRLLASEATEPDTTQEPPHQRNHMTAREAARLAADAQAQALILTHHWEELGLDRAALEAQSVFDGLVMVARPGLSVFI